MLVDEKLISNEKKLLPYLAYQKLESAWEEPIIESVFYNEKDSLGSSAIFSNKYVPLILLDDKFIRHPESSNKDQIIEGGIMEQGRLPSFYHSTSISEGSYSIFKKMEMRSLSEYKNIIVIGDMSEYSVDIHPTVFGRMHGSTFVINSLIGLLLKNHHNLIKSVSLMVILTCLLCFVFYSNGFFKQILDAITQKHPVLNLVNIVSHFKIKILKVVPGVVFQMLTLFKEEFAAVFMFFTLYIIYVTFNMIPNIFLSLFIFYLNSKILDFVKKRNNC